MPVIEIPGRGNVEFPDGMPPEQILAKVRQFSAGPKDPTKGTVPQGVDTPNKFGRVLGIAKNHRPLSDQAMIGLVAPGAGSFLTNLLVQGGAQGAGALARGEVSEAPRKAAEGVLGQAAGGVLGKVGGAVRDKLPTMAGGLARFGRDAEAGLVKYLQDRVPPFKGMPDLRSMFQKQEGYDALHKFYDDSLNVVIEKGAGKTIQVPEAAAKALGLSGSGPTFQFPAHLAQRMGGLPGAPQQAPGTITVDAAKAAKAMTGKSSKFPGAYRAIASALDQADIGDPDARAAYRTAFGVKKMLAKQKALKGGQFNVQRAQEGLAPADMSETLTTRGLEADLRGILNPGGGPLIEQGSMAGPLGVAGGVAGSLGMGSVLPLWGHGGGAVGGALGGMYLGKKIPTYRNVPSTPNVDLNMLLRQYLQGGIQQGLST